MLRLCYFCIYQSITIMISRILYYMILGVSASQRYELAILIFKYHDPRLAIPSFS